MPKKRQKNLSYFSRKIEIIFDTKFIVLNEYK